MMQEEPYSPPIPTLRKPLQQRNSPLSVASPFALAEQESQQLMAAKVPLPSSPSSPLKQQATSTLSSLHPKTLPPSSLHLESFRSSSSSTFVSNDVAFDEDDEDEDEDEDDEVTFKPRDPTPPKKSNRLSISLSSSSLREENEEDQQKENKAPTTNSVVAAVASSSLSSSAASFLDHDLETNASQVQAFSERLNNWKKSMGLIKQRASLSAAASLQLVEANTTPKQEAEKEQPPAEKKVEQQFEKLEEETEVKTHEEVLKKEDVESVGVDKQQQSTKTDCITFDFSDMGPPKKTRAKPFVPGRHLEKLKAAREEKKRLEMAMNQEQGTTTSAAPSQPSPVIKRDEEVVSPSSTSASLSLEDEPAIRTEEKEEAPNKESEAKEDESKKQEALVELTLTSVTNTAINEHQEDELQSHMSIDVPSPPSAQQQQSQNQVVQEKEAAITSSLLPKTEQSPLPSSARLLGDEDEKQTEQEPTVTAAIERLSASLPSSPSIKQVLQKEGEVLSKVEEDVQKEATAAACSVVANIQALLTPTKTSSSTNKRRISLRRRSSTSGAAFVAVAEGDDDKVVEDDEEDWIIPCTPPPAARTAAVVAVDHLHSSPVALNTTPSAIEKELRGEVILYRQQWQAEQAERERLEGVIAEYEKAFEIVLAEEKAQYHREHALRLYLEEENGKLKGEAEAMAAAFTDLKGRYQQLKGINQNFRANEEALKQSLAEAHQECAAWGSKYESLRGRAEDKLRGLAERLESTKMEHAKREAALSARAKLLESKQGALVAEVEMRTRENRELLQICEQLMAALGVSGGEGEGDDGTATAPQHLQQGEEGQRQE